MPKIRVPTSLLRDPFDSETIFASCEAATECEGNCIGYVGALELQCALLMNELERLDPDGLETLLQELAVRSSFCGLERGIDSGDVIPVHGHLVVSGAGPDSGPWPYAVGLDFASLFDLFPKT
jgi:hypothetical protein